MSIFVDKRIDVLKNKIDWENKISREIVPLEVIDCGDDFYGMICPNSIANMRIYEIVSSAHTVRRPFDFLSKYERKFFKLIYQISGKSKIFQNDDYLIIENNEFCIYDTKINYEVNVLEESHFIVMIFPQEEISNKLIINYINNKFIFNKSLFKIFSEIVKNTLLFKGELSEEEESQICISLIDIIITQIRNLEVNYNLDLCKKHTLKLICNYIQENLQNPDLSLLDIARKFKMSLRYLYNIFECINTTPADYILQARLNKCKMDILNLSKAKTKFKLSTIALNNGFSDYGTFFYAFRRKFGVSPSRYKLFCQESN